MNGRERDADVMRAMFELDPQRVYLNSAGQTPRLHAVLAAAHEAIERNARPWRTALVDYLARPEQVRRLAARVFGATSDAIALAPSVAYAMSFAARCLFRPADGRVLILRDEHASCDLAWGSTGFAVEHVARDEHRDWTAAICARIDHDVGVVVTPACHWHDGARVDLARVAAQARRVGARLVIDATQALGVLDLDLPNLDADLVVAAGHKWLLGAPGLAYACIAARHHAAAALEAQPWARVGGVDAGGRVSNQRLPGAARFDASGILASPALAMAEPALAQVLEWGIEPIRIRLAQWQSMLCEALEADGLGDWIACRDSPHLTALRPPRQDPREVVAALAQQGIDLALRGSTLRISPYLHNSTDDALRLVDALRARR